MNAVYKQNSGLISEKPRLKSLSVKVDPEDETIMIFDCQFELHQELRSLSSIELFVNSYLIGKRNKSGMSPKSSQLSVIGQFIIKIYRTNQENHIPEYPSTENCSELVS